VVSRRLVYRKSKIRRRFFIWPLGDTRSMLLHAFEFNPLTP